MEGPWEVISQRETTKPDPNGNGYLSVMEVKFRTRKGTIGTVDVPKDRYTVENVTDAINTYAEQIDGVMSL